MAEVVGGKTKSLVGRAVEIVGWFPVLALLLTVGGASMMNDHHMVEFPDWIKSLLGIYDGARDKLMGLALDKETKFADAAVMGVSFLTMASRKILSFAFSIGGFVVLIGIAWLLLRNWG